MAFSARPMLIDEVKHNQRLLRDARERLASGAVQIEVIPDGQRVTFVSRTETVTVAGDRVAGEIVDLRCTCDEPDTHLIKCWHVMLVISETLLTFAQVRWRGPDGVLVWTDVGAPTR